MSPLLILENIGVYSLQAAALILAGLLLTRLFRAARPLFFLQLLCAAVLLLPLAQPWKRPVTKVVRMAPGRVQLPAQALERVDRRVPADWDWAAVGLFGLGAGVAARMIWLLAGLARLRGMRRYAEEISAGVAVSTEVAGPVTFGLWNPIILLPPSVLTLPDPAKAAILAHERAHIRRKDWLFAVWEELVLCLLWFHPAVWLLVSQIRLEREKAVDREACRLAESPEVYMDALLAVAGVGLQPYLVSAPQFIRRRQLAERIQSLITEGPVSKTRMIASYGAIFCVLAAVTVWVTASFPLRGAPQLTEGVPDNVSIQGAELVFGSRPTYPMAARRAGVEGLVELEATVADNGEVADARVLSGPAELRKAALAAVLNWQFRPGAKLARIMITFRPGAPPSSPNVTKFFLAHGLPAELEKTLRARLQPFEGQPFTDEIYTVIQSVSRGLRIRVEPNTAGAAKETVVFIGPSITEPPATARTGASAQAANLISKVDPVYPPLARQARIQGTVRFDITIDRTGSVSAIHLVAGHPLLVSAAQDAVRQYRYRVAIVNGQPAEVNTTVDVTFTL